jgi:hypothetical protein
VAADASANFHGVIRRHPAIEFCMFGELALHRVHDGYLGWLRRDGRRFGSAANESESRKRGQAKHS